jgi:tetratricopeptide (TPR) repeat protein
MIKQVPPIGLNSQPYDKFWPDPDRLDSWKEIASYLRREVRTVQLWEKNEGMPVHRHFHRQLGSVFALRSEIESWKRRVSRQGGEPEAAPEAPANPSRIMPDCVTIYLLPPKNTTFTIERQSLGHGIVAKIVAGLERLHPGQLRVVGPEFLGLRQAGEPASSVAVEKSTDYGLRCTLEEDGPGLRIEVALLSIGTRAVLWSYADRFRGNDFHELTSRVAEQIVQCLWLKVLSCSASFPVIERRERRSSREAYLKGRFFWNQRNEEGLRKAIHCFESAIQEDPQFALAYSGLADSLTLLSFYEIVSPYQAMPSARRAALKAVELDPTLAEAHASLADILLHFDRDWQAADQEYRRSIRCNPGYALGYHWYANLLSARGQHEAAQIAIMQALEIDPVSIITQVWAGVTCHLAHRFDEAVTHYQSALELDPQFIWAHMYMAQALEQQGNFKEALQEFETTIQLAGGSDSVKAMKAHTHAVSGDTSSARKILRELKAMPPSRCIPSYDIAATYAALGESSQAVLWLNRACQERNMKLFTLTQDPRFDPLRHRSEFKEIVGQMGLAQPERPGEPPRH